MSLTNSPATKHTNNNSDPATTQSTSVPVFLEYGFRPFFMLAGLWATLAIPMWLAGFMGMPLFPVGVDPLLWHQHEMLFGFAGAAMAGFILTAVPNWTGRAPVSGWPLLVLVSAWCLGRVGTLSADWLGALPTAVLDLSFSTLLVCIIARELIRGRNWRNLPVLALVFLFGLGNWLVHFDHMGITNTAFIGIRLAIFVLAILVAFIGGRIVPSFTRNWLKQKGATAFPAPFGALDTAALSAIVLVLAFQLLWPDSSLTAIATLLAAALHGLRSIRWKPWTVASEPLLLALHLGYAWLVIGLLLVGLASLDTGVTQSAALHALTIGAFATMILAVMTRASLGHTGRPLTANGSTAAIYVLITLSAMARLITAFLTDGYVMGLWISAGSWTAAFGLFTWLYWPVLTKPKR